MWDEVFKNGPSKNCGRQPLKILKAVFHKFYLVQYWILCSCFFFFFFSIWVFFHEHSRFTGKQGKKEAISLTPLYRFHPLHRHLDISLVTTAESSPLHIACSRTEPGIIGFRAHVANHQAMCRLPQILLCPFLNALSHVTSNFRLLLTMERKFVNSGKFLRTAFLENTSGGCFWIYRGVARTPP